MDNGKLTVDNGELTMENGEGNGEREYCIGEEQKIRC